MVPELADPETITPELTKSLEKAGVKVLEGVEKLKVQHTKAIVKSSGGRLI